MTASWREEAHPSGGRELLVMGDTQGEARLSEREFKVLEGAGGWGPAQGRLIVNTY